MTPRLKPRAHVRLGPIKHPRTRKGREPGPSTFVMISQNRADAKRQVLADEQWKTVQQEDRQNEQLLDLSEQILALTREIHASGRPTQTDPQ